MFNWLRPNLSRSLLLVVHDVCALYLSIGMVHQIRLGFWVRHHDISLFAVIAVTIAALYLLNVYVISRQESRTKLLLRTFLGVALSGGLIGATIYLTKTTDVSEVFYRGNLPLSMFCFAIWASLVRYLVTVFILRYGRKPKWLVIGDGVNAQMLAARQPQMAGDISLDFLPEKDPDLSKIELYYYDELVKVRNPPGLLYAERVSGLVLANDEPLPDTFVTQMMTIRLKGVPILDFADFYERFLLRVPVLQLADHWFALSQGFSLLHHNVQWKLKRFIDIVIAALGLVCLAPLILLIGLLARLTSPGPIIYNQTRCGRRGNTFRLHKFRTMVVDAEREGAKWAQPNDPRVTKFGRFLRNTRLDELPQLWNVLLGQMSFIGPRPERPGVIEELEREIPYYDLRHLVKPGITGWAQVMYPYGASVEDAKNKLEFDLYYIKNYSLVLDLYILLRTIRVVMFHSGR